MTSPVMKYVHAHCRMAGETLSEFGTQWKQLTEQDRADLQQWVDEEEAAIKAQAS